MPAEPVTPPVVPPVVPPPAETPPATPQWFEGEKFQGHESLKKFKTQDDAVLSYVNLEKTMGNRVAMPVENAPQAEWDAFYAKTGRPEKPEQYGEYTVPEGMPWDKVVEGRFQQNAHKLGLTKKQAEGVLDFYTKESTTATDEMNRASSAGEEEAWASLRTMWGANTDRNVALAQRAVSVHGDPELSAYLDRTGAGNNPAVLRLLARYGESLMEDGVLKPEHVGKSADEIKNEINALQNHKAWADREHPEFASVHARLRELYQHAYPTV